MSVYSNEFFMLTKLCLTRVGWLMVLGCLAASLSLARAQNAFSPGGNDYFIAGALVGDQAGPQAAVGTNGGVLVWSDNGVDGRTNGLGISAVRLTAGLVKSGNIFRVNSILADDQEKPQVSLLQNGGAAIVWQGGKLGFQKIFVRFLNATSTNFIAADVRVNTYTNSFQINPVVATLTNGTVVVIWASDGQDGSYQGIYGQRFTSAGVKSGSEFRINQFTANNQRSPAVAALATGGFVVTWISELERGPTTVDVYARLFDSAGAATGDEFLVNSGTAMCASPSVSGGLGGGFAVAWAALDVFRSQSSGSSMSDVPATAYNANSWDVMAGVFNVSAGVASVAAVPFRLNSMTLGDQNAPKLSAFGGSYLCAWVSLGQDTAWEGIYGQFFSGAGSLAGVEFRVNTTTAGRQFNPAVGSDGVSRFLVSWSSFVAGTGFDLLARVYDLIRVDIVPIAEGLKVSWNTQPGSRYQVQVSTDYLNWSNYGSVRVAPGFGDSLTVNSLSTMAAYRVIRIQ